MLAFLLAQRQPGEQFNSLDTMKYRSSNTVWDLQRVWLANRRHDSYRGIGGRMPACSVLETIPALPSSRAGAQRLREDRSRSFDARIPMDVLRTLRGKTKSGTS